jgi:hypothetical protein
MNEGGALREVSSGSPGITGLYDESKTLMQDNWG